MLKAKELSHNLVGKRKTVEFSKPVYLVERDDSDLLRKKILDSLTLNEIEIRFSKGILHYMKQNAKSDKPFTLNAHVRERLENWEECC